VVVNRIVVIGGSVAAATAIQVLRAEGFDGQLTLVSDEELPPYSRVPLSKGVLSGREVHEPIGIPTSSAVDVRLSTPAIGLDLSQSAVITQGGAIHFDRLLIATGARARRIGSDDQRERVFRDVGDVTDLQRALLNAASVLIVGGGVLGMEIASTCLKLGLAVTVVDIVLPMTKLLGTSIAARVVSIAERAGLRIVVSPGGVTLVGSPEPCGALCSDGRLLTADVVISAVGDEPNIEWLDDSGLGLNSGVLVDERCQASEHVFAAGDVAATTSQATGQVRRSPTFTNAVEQGRVAALGMLHGEDAPSHQPSRYMWTEQFDLDIKMAGAMGPFGDPTVVEGDIDSMSALLAWPGAGAATTLMSVNFKIPVARLKRGVQPVPN
jgi:3-phenylpropionate/trans-cinnamate dioxygenase ferredoxin reductase component